MEVVDYTQNADTVYLKWCQPTICNSAAGRRSALRAAGDGDVAVVFSGYSVQGRRCG